MIQVPRYKAKNVSTAWLIEAKDEESKEKIKTRLRSSKDVLDQLGQIINDMVEELNSKETLSDYSQTDWAYKAAHRNGLREAYKRVLDLITIEG